MHMYNVFICITLQSKGFFFNEHSYMIKHMHTLKKSKMPHIKELKENTSSNMDLEEIRKQSIKIKI